MKDIKPMKRFGSMRHARLFIPAAIGLVTACASGSAAAPASPGSAPTPSTASSARSEANVVVNGMASQPTSLPPEQPAGDPRNYFGDPELYALLNHAPWTPEAAAALAAYEASKGSVFMDLVGDVAEDSSASIASRVNALNLIEQRKAFREFEAVRAALHAYDPRVRAIALQTAWGFWVAELKDGLKLVRDALDDPAPGIQAKILQLLGNEDVDLLRDFAKRPTVAPSVVPLVTGMIRAAEENGAALVPVDSTTGVLQRTSASGLSLTYTPTQKWGASGASIGTVEVRDAKGRIIPMPADIEVVGNVVPVFFSADGKYILYEAGRHIHVKNVSSGVDRDVGEGIAPRVRPFTDQFIFLVEDTTGRTDLRDHMKLRYEVRSLPFSLAATATTPIPAWSTLGALEATLAQDQHGNSSPVRWMRVEEHAGQFYLRGTNVLTFTLPNPFQAGAGS
jgi:hypothetical protein